MNQIPGVRFSPWLYEILCMAAGFSVVLGGPPPDWEGQIHLRQGDRLSGRIEAIKDGGSTLVLRHPLLTDPLSIESTAVARFEPFAPPGIRFPRHWQVDLVNGDRLDALDWELTRDGLTLETESAGRVTVPRAGVRFLTRMSGETPLLDGPGVPADWSVFIVPSLKRTPNGGLSLQMGAISRALPEMPDVFRLDLSIRYAGSPNWLLWFHAEDAGVEDMSACLLNRNMNGFGFWIKRFKGGKANLGGAVSATVNPTSAGRHGQPVSENVTLFFDRSRRSMRIFLNGEALGPSLKIPPFESFGNFLTLHSKSNVELHDIRLSPLTELPPDMVDQEGPRDSDMIWLRGNKRIKGNIDLPETGIWRVRDASGGREIAKDEILCIAFAESGEPVARGRDEALVALRDGSRLTMRITGVEEEGLSGESHVAGDIRLLLKDVVWIDWGDTGDLDTYTPAGGLDRQVSAWRVDSGFGGEILTASDLGLEGDRLTLRNRHAGEVTFPRGQALVMTHMKNLPVLLMGRDKKGWSQAGDIDSFTADPSSLRLEPGSVISRRIPDLPERFQIGFRVSEVSPNAGIKIRFGASQPLWQGANAYEIMIWGRQLSFRLTEDPVNSRSKDNMAAAMVMLQPMNALFPQRNPHLTTVAGTRFDFFIDSAKPAMWVYIDGKQIAVWKSFIRLPKPGNFFTLGSNQRGAGVLPIGISDLLLAGWDGVPPGEGEFSTEEDQILLRNQDRIQGTLRSIEAGKIFFRVQGMDLELPADRLNTIRLANTGLSKASGGTDVEIKLADGSLLRMTSAELELDGNSVAGISPVFRSVRVPADSIHVIRWDNPKQ